MKCLKCRCLIEPDCERVNWSDGSVEHRSDSDCLTALKARVTSDYKEACYWLKCVAPQCQPLDDTSGVLTQLSNYMAGQSEQLAEARAALAEVTAGWRRGEELRRTIQMEWDGTVLLDEDIDRMSVTLSREWLERATAAGGDRE
jgi:hypothetical protein